MARELCGYLGYKMDSLKIRFKVCSPRHKGVCREMEGRVDTRAIVSVISESVLESLGIEARREEKFKLADGRIVKRKVGIAEIRLTISGEEKVTGAMIIFGETGDETILGVSVLEQLGLEVDLVNRRIIESKAYI